MAKRKKNTCGLYEIVNLVNGRRYIGSSVGIEKRLVQHRSNLKKNIHSNAHLQSAYNLYGAENFRYSILVILDTAEQFPSEQRYLDRVRESGETIYNMAIDVTSGMKGRTASEETRQKISLAGKGRKHSEETKQKISLGNTGKVLSEETKKKLSESHLGRKASDEVRKKMSDSTKGRFVSEEAREKSRRSNKETHASNPSLAMNTSIRMKELWAKRRSLQNKDTPND